MRLCSACALVFLTSTFSTGSESTVPSVTVKLHHPATLPCYERCPGVVRWTMFHNPTDVLAECDQTSCRSVKEGYQMIHDQYLKGNFSLTITDADFSKRAWYTCDCDGEHLCDVQLKMEPLNTTVQKKPGESIALELDVSDPIEVIYNGTGAAGPSSDPICTVDGRSTECRPEYASRAPLISALELRGLTPADSGVYTVRDIRNKEVLHTYTVTVQGDSDAQGRNRKPGESLSSAPSDDQACPLLDQGAVVPVWVFVLVLVAVCAVLGGLILFLWRKNHQLQKGPRRNGVQNGIPDE